MRFRRVIQFALGLALIVGLVAAGAVVLRGAGRGERQAAVAEKAVWTCSMHPRSAATARGTAPSAA